ncbi:hypothetical protein [Cellvibrio mixtus]|uniref:hypothetical protein n=1 Tax=Cellvibrio mixtus TaxID=39650 RepID=UPI0005865802|nr:hypothetical protein [Cellvibrio mixtus]
MKERPILFSAPMIQAILSGRKTQTRRPINPLPVYRSPFWEFPWGAASSMDFLPIAPGHATSHEHPQGQPGDRLWVREAHYIVYAQGNPNGHVIEIDYKADPDYTKRMCPQKWRPSIHMPRWASRILLEVKTVGAERLQQMTTADAIAEGIEVVDCEFGRRWRCYTNPDSWYPEGKETAPLHSFQSLWNSIYGHNAWDLNPWVWKTEFSVLETTCQFWK